MVQKKVRVDGGGLRHNTGKVRMDLLPPDALFECARVFTEGTKKYAVRNWERGMLYSTPYASLQRHTNQWWAGEDIDKELGTNHMANVATNALFLLSYQLRGLSKFDDRFKLGVHLG